MYDKVIQDIIDGKTGEIHPDVYQAYSENLRKAVGGVLSSEQYGDKYFDLQAQLQANVSRFAAYKAYHLTQQLNDKRNEWSNDDDFRKVAKAMLNTFNRYQAAEYNTATARARTAKQWTDFNADPISNELYPNLKWLPSRSATPREEHIPFYGLVLPKTDPFWQQNQPGNLWNCKCDWEETDEPAATSSPKTICAKGLEGNPAETGEVFTDECTYFKQAGKNRKEKDKVEEICERSGKKITLDKVSKSIANKQGECFIGGKGMVVEYNMKQLNHYVDSLFGNKRLYWLKNAVIEQLPEIVKSSECIGRKVSDTTHNTAKKTLKIKRATDYYYYFKTILPNGETAYIHLGRWRETQKMYIYAITKNIPENIETI